jgi:hypothetical protein
MQIVLHVFLYALMSTVLSLPISFTLLLDRSTRIHPLASRQVGDGVSGNQTGDNGTTGGTGLGDGNGVGFAGTGNDIDTGTVYPPLSRNFLTDDVGDDFDIGDGNITMGDGNTFEIGDRITNINIPLVMLGGAGTSDGKNGSREMQVDIRMRLKVM